MRWKTIAAELFGCVLAAHAAVCPAQESPPATAPPADAPELQGGFTFSSTQKDGRVEWKIEGSSASFLTPTLIEIHDARAIHYIEDGDTIVATSEMALLDKETREVRTDEFVTIVTENSVTTGTGMEWDQEKQWGRLKKDVKVVYNREGEEEGLFK